MNCWHCRCVYKCVCKQFSERLFADLLQSITSHLEQVHLRIQVCLFNHFSSLPLLEKRYVAWPVHSFVCFVCCLDYSKI